MPRIIGGLVHNKCTCTNRRGPRVYKMAASAEGEGSASSSAHSSSWNPVESGTSSTCPSVSEGTESSVSFAASPCASTLSFSEGASPKKESAGRYEAREGSLFGCAKVLLLGIV